MLSKLRLSNLSKLKSHSRLRAIIANTGWLFADRILRMGASLVVGVWIARYLGAQQYGLFNYALAFVTLFTPVLTLGLDEIVVRHVVRESSNKEEILGTTFWLKFLGGIASVLLAVGITLFLGEREFLKISLVAILAIAGIFRAADTIELWFQSQVQSKYAVIAKNIAFLLNTLIKVALILTKAPLLAFAWVTLAEFAMNAVGLAIVYQSKGFSFWSWRWNFQVAKTLLKESLPLIFSGFAIMIFMKIDQIMLGQMIGDKEVGVYSAAVRISEVWYFIPGAIVPSVAPSIYAAKDQSDGVYYQRLGQLFRLLTCIALAIAVPMTFLSDKIIMVLFGNGYAGAGAILAVHIWTSIFVFLGFASSPWFIAEGLNHVTLGKTVFGAILNIILNFLLIPQYLGLGAAIATIISQAAAAFLCNAFDRRTQKIFKIQLQSLLLFYKY
ncbi:Polysaccharide biosynthesis protein [Trichormus variabilis ATCC 29413]|uniref:Polysaccharide biosynthesis protein n=2 Tax=Anabaena variabilis TaxID=264691 RepID=Q3MDC8_TRIV2|nr:MULTISPECIES: flippase [Nostocaceae]ABA21008.1 Polysaccharide biosynthesis protein [Trichormus variabilis ATCC 29413]MBC1214156.1 flippase [Trichormus variabilis ARAD]MBC1258570.1 flippase [Trichormus variabilis V5]MBC1269128.1 flippase [Trichormus variabilis FSR]MBC1300671.1 flippase [Trichormus variabilis N2B]